MAANQTVTVLEADGVTTTDVEILGTARQAAAASKSVAMSTEDKAVLDAIAASLAILDNVTQTANAPITTDTALVVAIHPDSQNDNGRAAAADSAPVVLANEDLTELTAVKTAVQLIDDAIVADDAAFTPATTKTMIAGFQADETATDSVDEGDAGAARMTLDRKLIVTTQPHTQGGATSIRKIDLDETPSVVKASRGQLFGFYIVNRTTSARYLRFYNVAAASVTVGTTAALVGPIEIPANASDHTALIINFPYGIEFDTAMSWAVTTGFADNDTGAPGANDILANAFIK